MEQLGALAQADQALTGAGQGYGRAGGRRVGDGDGEVVGVVPQVYLGAGSGGVLAYVGEGFLDRAVEGALGGRANVGRELAGQGRLDAAVGDQLLEIGEGGLGGELGFLAAGGAQQRDHVAEFVEGIHAQGADRAGRVAGVGFLGGDLECSGLHGDEADLLGDDVVHLPGQLGAFADEDGLGVHGAFVFAGLLDLGELARHVVAGLHELTEQDRGEGCGQHVGELDEGPGPVAGERGGQEPGEGARHRVRAFW